MFDSIKILKTRLGKKNTKLEPPDIATMDYADFEKFIPLQDGDQGLVIKVYDGDTLTIGWRYQPSYLIPAKLVRESVRIRGIDTPEIRSKNAEEKVIALQARDRLAAVTMGEYVTLISPGTDKYGRILCDLQTSRVRSISEYMLQAPDLCRVYGC